MNIKKIISVVSIVILLLATFSADAVSRLGKTSGYATKYNITNDSLRMVGLQRRVIEIQGMDFTNLSAGEKIKLRKELLGMKKEAVTARGHGGVYLSIGALIVIILLLILLLR